MRESVYGLLLVFGIDVFDKMGIIEFPDGILRL